MIAALCVVAALGASVTIPAAAERTSLVGTLIEKVQTALLGIGMPEAKPFLGPLPRPKPERDIAEAPVADPPKPSTGTVAQCGHATIIARPFGDGLVYRATFAREMIDEMAGKGCASIQQGCNTCTVRYTGCDDAVKAACTDVGCLVEKCERKVVCSAKLCTVEGEAPTCESRIAQAACKKSLFGDEG